MVISSFKNETKKIRTYLRAAKKKTWLFQQTNKQIAIAVPWLEKNIFRIKILCLKKSNTHPPKRRQALPSLLILSISMLEDCKELLGARGGALPNGITNSSIFGWMNLCLGWLTTSSLDLEKGWALLTNRVELISSKCIHLTVSVRWGFGISLSAVFSWATLVQGRDLSIISWVFSWAEQQHSSSAELEPRSWYLWLIRVQYIPVKEQAKQFCGTPQKIC